MPIDLGYNKSMNNLAYYYQEIKDHNNILKYYKMEIDLEIIIQ